MAHYNENKDTQLRADVLGNTHAARWHRPSPSSLCKSYIDKSGEEVLPNRTRITGSGLEL